MPSQLSGRRETELQTGSVGEPFGLSGWIAGEGVGYPSTKKPALGGLVGPLMVQGDNTIMLW